MADKKIGYKDVLKQKEYLKIIVAALINRFGDSIDGVAWTWLVYELTGNAAWSAVIFGANQAPSVLITPLAGAWVEGRKKKYIMVITDLIRAFCVALVASGYLFGFLRPWMLLFTTLVISTAEAFRGPANTALTPKVLDSECYEYGMSLSSTLSSVVQLIGMAVAAGFIAKIGVAGAIYIDMATFLLSALIILFVKAKEENLSRQSFHIKEYTATLREGFRYAGKKRSTRFIIAICLFLNVMLVPFNSLLAPLAGEILKGGAEVLSLLGIAVTLGMLFGSFTYPMVQKVIKERVLLFIGGVGLGLFYLGLILCQPFYTSKWFMYAWVTVLSVLFGYFISLCTSLVNVQIVKRTEEGYLARVASIVSALGSAATPIASFLIGAAVTHISTEALFIVVGILDLVGCIFILKSDALEDTAPVSVPLTE